MALVGLDLGEAGAAAGGVQRAHDVAALGGRIEPVRRERQHAEAHAARLCEGLGQHPLVLGGQVEVVQRAGDVEIGVGVEAVDEAGPLVAQIAFHLEVGVEAPAEAVALQFAAELALQGGLGEIGDVGGHAGHGQAFFRPHAGDLIGPAPPVRVGHDRLAADLVEGDVLGRMPRRRADAHRAEQLLRIVRRPLQHLHPAHRAADHGEQGVDAQRLDQHRLGADHVGDGDHRERQAIGIPGPRIDRGRTRRSHAAADDIGADDEIALRVQRQARTHDPAPPAGLAGGGIGPGGVLIHGQGVADQDGVGLARVQPAIGLVSDIQRFEPGAGVQAQALAGGKAQRPTVRLARSGGLGRVHQGPWTAKPFRCQ